MIRAMLNIALVAGAFGCGSGTEQAADEGALPPITTKKAPETKFDKATLFAEAIQVSLVPSPAEMQRALTNAGLTSRLSTMVAARDIQMTSTNKDQIAVRSGVLLADLVLSVKTAAPETQVARLAQLKQGFVAMGVGADVVQTLDELSARIASGSGSRDDLVKEFDELSGVMVPKLKFDGGDWMVPLVQAGAWLEGAHLVSGAIIAEGKFEEGGRMLKQPAVVDYFLKYVRGEGRTRAPDVVIDQLEQTLTTLKEIAAKDDLTEEDVKSIHSATGALLNLL
jgi:hypothetical protein